MSEETFCQACGEEMKEWHNGIYECDECGNMIDLEIFNDDEEEWDWSVKRNDDTV